MNRNKINELLKEEIYKHYDLQNIEALATEEVYNIILQFINLFDAQCDKADKEITDLIREIFQYKEINSEVIDIVCQKGEPIQERFLVEISVFNEVCDNGIEVIQRILLNVFEKTCRADNDIFNTMAQKRLALLEKRLRGYFEGTLAIFRDLQLAKIEKIADNIKCIGKILEGGFTKYQQIIENNKSELDREEEILNTAVEKERYLKIFEYKDISKLALSMNYELVRYNGDHAIYKHKESNTIVPIPVRTIGSGLSYAIQKQLRKNSI